MSAPVLPCQPKETPVRQHTPFPWHADDEAIFAADGVLARIPNHPENGKNWKADAAFIVEACASHASLKARIEGLEGALREAKEALGRCYNVTEWPADGTSTQDDAIRTIDSALSNGGTDGRK